MDLTAPAFTRTDPTNFNWGSASPDPRMQPDTFSVRWTGFITVPTTGHYTFYNTTDDGVRLTINGQRIIDKLVPQASTEWSGSIDLVAGQKYATAAHWPSFNGPARESASRWCRRRRSARPNCAISPGTVAIGCAGVFIARCEAL